LVSAVPYAKTAGFAKFAGDSSKLNGRKSALNGTPGTIVAVGKSGKLPGSLLDLSQYYTKSDVDSLVKPLSSGLKAITGANVTDSSLSMADLGSKKIGQQTTTVGSAIPLPAGACQAQLTGNFGDGIVGDLVVGTLTDANGNAALPNTAAFIPSIVIKTSQGRAIPNLIV
jgi:hypothetical protein